MVTINVNNNHNNSHVSPSSNVHVSIVIVILVVYVQYGNVYTTQEKSRHTVLVNKIAGQRLVKAKVTDIAVRLVPI